VLRLITRYLLLPYCFIYSFFFLVFRLFAYLHSFCVVFVFCVGFIFGTFDVKPERYYTVN
jgi:hypothetical protein